MRRNNRQQFFSMIEIKLSNDLFHLLSQHNFLMVFLFLLLFDKYHRNECAPSFRKNSF